jgi:DNA repair exonuclease SbcCD ATPase subunit
MMKIVSLKVEHFRKFTQSTALAGLSSGVNVLAEANEFGKSTLLAAVRGVLFERHSSKAQTVMAMQHHTNKTSPTIALDFELSGKAYRIEKRFLHKEPYAKLTLPDGSVHQGDAAEEKLQQVMGFTRAGNAGSKPENIGMWGALWVPQRKSVEQPLIVDAARQTIHGCLEAEVGSIAGGARGQLLLADVRSQIAKIQNGVSKPVGRYKEVLASLSTADQDLSQLKMKRSSLLTDMSDLTAAKLELQNAQASGEELRTEHLLEAAHQSKASAQRFEEREQAEKTTEELAANRLAAIESEIDSRTELKSQLSASLDRVDNAVKAEDKAAKDLQEATEALSTQSRTVADAQSACDEAGKELQTARIIYDFAVSGQAIAALDDRLVQAEEAQDLVDTLEAKRLGFTITSEGLELIRRASSRVLATEATLQAQATRVTLNVLPVSVSKVTIAGVSDFDQPINVVEDLNIEVEGIGTFKIHPGIKDRETLLFKRATEQDALKESLKLASATTVEDAEQEFSDRQSCEQNLSAAKKEVSLLTLADVRQGVDAGLDSLRNHRNVRCKTLDAGMADAGLEDLPTPEEARRVKVTAESKESALAEALAVDRALLPPLQEEFTRVGRLHSAAEGEVKAATEEQESIKNQLRKSAIRETDESLLDRRTSLTDAVVVQRRVLAELRKSRPTDSVLEIQTRIDRYIRAKELFSENRTQTLQRIAILKNRIEREQGLGIEEQIDEKRRTVEMLQAEEAAFVRELRILNLLLKHLEKAEREAKERYMAPIVKRIEPYLQKLFPGAGIVCDEDFRITGMSRPDQNSEQFDSLSDGTQEQVAVLTRLAFADLLLESGRPAMVILDDALVYSDPVRLDRMFDLLTQAGTRMQILILTCRGELFTRLGGTRVRAEPSA